MGEVADKLGTYSSDPALLRAYLGSLGSLIKSGNLKKYYKLLTDFDFIAAKINHPEFGVQPLIEDYDLIDDPELFNHPEYKPEKVKALKLIQGALQLSAHILNQDTKQLAGQLPGRLLYFDAPEIQGLLQQIPQTKTTCLRSLTASLAPPGGALVRTLGGHSSPVSAVAVTPDGEHVISGSQDGTLKVWDLHSQEETFTLGGHRGSVNAVVVTPDGEYIISGSQDGTLKVWDLHSQEEKFTLGGHRGSVNAVAVTRDGIGVISASSDHSLKAWNLRTGEVLHTFIGHCASVEAVTVVYTNNNNWVISGSYNDTLRVWNLETGQEELTLGESDMVWSIAATPNGERIICGSQDGTLTIWKVETWEKERTLTAHSDSVRAIVVTPDGKQVISGSSDGALKIWKVGTWENETTLNAHNTWILDVAVTPDGKQAISRSGNPLFSSDYTLKVWKIENYGKQFSFDSERYTETEHSTSVEVVAFTPDGKQVISCSKDGTVKFWKVGTWENEATFKGQSKSAEALGNYENNKYFVLEADEVKCFLHSTRKTLPPFLLATTADGKRQIWASGDETLKVWNLQTRKVIASFTGESEIRCCAIAPDDITIVAGEASGLLHFLRLEGY
jgi:WD40 repeat protein